MNTISYTEYIEKSVPLLEELLAINTCQPEGNEDKAAEYLMQKFPAGTQMKKLIHTESRSSLVVKVPGSSEGKALVFVGHLDTVPYGPLENWNTQPGQVTYDGDRIYCRGAADMKGGAAAMTAAALYLLENKIVPEKDIYFCYTADEENEGLGAFALAQEEFMNSAAEVIIAEPTRGLVSVGEKSALWLKIKSHGVQAHGSRPELAVNGIEMLMELAARIARCIDMNTEKQFFGHSTMAVTKLNGGFSTNVIPAEAEMVVDIRLIPGQSNDLLLEKITEQAESLCKEHQPLEITIQVINNRPSVEVRENAPLLSHMESVLEELGLSTERRGTIFYTDASQIIPCHDADFVILGPGDDRMAHQSNEFIDIKDLKTMAEIYLKYITEYYLAE